jgi:hypothetical protein
MAWGNRVRKLKVTLLALVLCLGCGGKNIVQSPSGRLQVSGGGYNQFTPEQEIEIGRQNAAEVNRKMPVLPESSQVTRYVQQLGSQLARVAPGDVKWPFTFHVINQKEINAFALPGGPIYVNVGTIQAADDEGELAGVIAHEISHVVLRHATEQASKQMMAQLPLVILGGVLPQSTAGQLARLGISFGAQSVFLKYSRDAESQADVLGSQIMYDAGYNPYSMVEFFDKLNRQEGSRAPQFLSDHPNPGNRVQNVSKVVTKYPKKSYRKNSTDFEQAKSEVGRLKPLTAEQIAQQQQQSETVGDISYSDVRPSGQFRTMNHNYFQISYPSNWEVSGDQNSTVTIAPRVAVAENAIAYGVMASGYKPQQRGESLSEATQELVQALQQSNPDMRVSGGERRMNVDGRPALAVNLVGSSPVSSRNGVLREQDTVVSVQRDDGTLLFFIFIAPERDFRQLEPTYERMIQDLRIR